MAVYKGLLNEELNDQYSLPNVIRMIKSRSMKWSGMEHFGGEESCIQGFGGETWGKETTWKNQVQMGG